MLKKDNQLENTIIKGEMHKEKFKIWHSLNQGCGSGSGFNRVCGSGSGSRRAKMTHKSRPKFVKVHVLKCWMASFES
jgi:hypothetical protein